MFCRNCGMKVQNNGGFCPNCGTRLDTPPRGAWTDQRIQSPVYTTEYFVQKELIDGLKKRIMGGIVIWGVVAAFQYIVGIFDILSDSESTLWGIVVLIIAVLNTRSCIEDYHYYKEVVRYPVGIVEKYKPMAGSVAALMYNCTVAGIFGLFLSLYTFVVRRFVMKNEMGFKLIEEQYYDRNDTSNSDASNAAYSKKVYEDGRMITIYTIDGDKISTKKIAPEYLSEQYIRHIINGKVYLHRRETDGTKKLYFISEEKYNELLSNISKDNETSEEQRGD